MLRVTIELLPHGDASQPRHMGTAVIANDGTGDGQTGNYAIRLSKWGRPDEDWRKGRIVGFDRKGRGAWDLLFLGLRNLVGSRNDPRFRRGAR